MSTDKNQAVLDWLKTYPGISALGFNFGTAEDGACNFIPAPSDNVIRTYIDGSALKHYTFAVTWYKDFASDAFAAAENLADTKAIEAFMAWIDDQNASKQYPSFPSECQIEAIRNLQDIPSTSGYDSNRLAKYMVQVRIEYIDSSGKIWS